MKVLNLYAGIGGNRKLWKDCEVTAVEWDKETAKVYQDYFPDDNVIVGDAHKYLIDHFSEFDFIWSSPPCPTHSILNTVNNGLGRKLKYPDMSLYQEIIFLNNWFKGKYCVENVKPYYTPLIPPSKILHRHFYWTNFKLSNFEGYDKNRKHNDIKETSNVYGFEISKTNISDKTKALRNMVDPALGLHIFNAAKGILTKSKTKQLAITL